MLLFVLMMKDEVIKKLFLEVIEAMKGGIAFLLHLPLLCI